MKQTYILNMYVLTVVSVECISAYQVRSAYSAISHKCKFHVVHTSANLYLKSKFIMYALINLWEKKFCFSIETTCSNLVYL